MSAQAKTHLEVRGGGRQWLRKQLTGNRMSNFEFTVMQELVYKKKKKKLRL